MRVYMPFNSLCVIRMTDDADSVIILDQTKLPNQEQYLTLQNEAEMWKAIHQLQVRGAPAIGIFAAYAMAVLAQHDAETDPHSFYEHFCQQADYLNTSRPTAVNLSWALKRMKRTAQTHLQNFAQLRSLLIAEARQIDAENLAMNEAMANYGVSLLREGDGILTHCNAGYLACLGYGTATAPIYKAHEKGMHIHVYADETRPLLQGARLTSYELHKAGVPVTVICDNMASLVMKQGKIQCVLVGCDRVAANGDFANKIGTSGVAILAKHYGIPFYTVAPSSTIDLNTPDGDAIPIEVRNGDEIGAMWYQQPMVLPQIDQYNPSFDVTDHRLLTAIITERGIIYPPFDVHLKKLFAEKG